jgi:hypothetical protein
MPRQYSLVSNNQTQLRRVRVLLGIVIAGLILSGLSALPLLREVTSLNYWVHAAGCPSFVTEWIGRVHDGLEKTYSAYPFMGYGTDWLAFGHFIIALFILGACVDPVRNVWIVRASMIACVLVIPTAIIAGFVRGIPLWWRAIDSSFGIIGFVPLWIADRLIRKMSV